MKNHTDLNLGEGLSILTLFQFLDSGIYRFIFNFWWRDSENHQFLI